MERDRCIVSTSSRVKGPASKQVGRSSSLRPELARLDLPPGPFHRLRDPWMTGSIALTSPRGPILGARADEAPTSPPTARR